MRIAWQWTNKRHQDVWRYLRNSRAAQGVVVFSLLCIAAMAFLVIYRILPLVQESPFIPLHYNVYIGVDRFGPWWFLLAMPVIAFIVLALNTMLAAIFSEQTAATVVKEQSNPVLSVAFLIMAPTVSFTMLVALVLIVLLNVSYV